jgi:hypothetical protein
MPKASKRAPLERKTYSWAQLIESRHARPPEKEPVRNSERGRPRLNMATYQTSVTLSKGDREALSYWQEQLSALLKRKVSLGEAAGFTAKVCQERLNQFQENEKALPATLQDLINALVNDPENE